MTNRLLAASALLALTTWLPAPAGPRDGAAATARGAQERDDTRFAVGVLRRDGVVLPFASFDRRWSSPWPSDVRALELPVTLGDVPKGWWGTASPPVAMTAWVDGVRGAAVRLDRPAMLPVMCEPRLAVRSDYTSAQPPPPLMAQPFPKDGLVTAGGPPVRPLTPVDPESADWSAAAVTILETFNNVEERAAREFANWRHPYPPSARQRMTIQLEALYRAPMDEEGWSAYYVEAVRRFPAAPGEEDCGLLTFVSGWVRISPAGKGLFDLAARITYCDRRGVSFMLPLGLMTVDEKIYWLYQISGYDREWYVVARPSPRSIELHVEYPAGSCPRL